MKNEARRVLKDYAEWTWYEKFAFAVAGAIILTVEKIIRIIRIIRKIN